MYKNILAAVDLSAVSQTVIERAKDIATKYSAALSIVYVMEYTPIIYGEGEFAAPVDSELLKTFENNSRKALAQFGKDFGIPEDHQYLRLNSIKHSVVEVAKEIQADLLVIGSHSKRGIEYILGSHAIAILNAAKCDVLAVRINV